MKKSSSSHDNTDSQLVLNQLVQDYLHDKKRKHRWRWVVRSFIFMIIVFSLYKALSSQHAGLATRAGAHVGMIDVKGVIADGQAASAENFSKSLEQAYANKTMKALVFRIDSPGGSPVQADYMYNAIQDYKKEYPNIKPTPYAWICVPLLRITWPPLLTKFTLHHQVWWVLSV